MRRKRLVIFELMRTEFSRRMLILFLYNQCCLSGQNCQLTPERGDWRENHLRSYLQLISFKGDRGMKFFFLRIMRTIWRKMNSNLLRSKRLVNFELMRLSFCAERWFCFCIARVVFGTELPIDSWKGGLAWESIEKLFTIGQFQRWLTNEVFSQEGKGRRVKRRRTGLSD